MKNIFIILVLLGLFSANVTHASLTSEQGTMCLNGQITTTENSQYFNGCIQYLSALIQQLQLQIQLIILQQQIDYEEEEEDTESSQPPSQTPNQTPRPVKHCGKTYIPFHCAQA